MFLGARLKKAYLKLKSRKGFSLAELLLAVLIMLSATAILTSTIALASAHYKDMTKTASAQLLCSALSVYVQNELEYATVTLVENGDKKVIKTGTDGAVLFRSESHNFGPDSYFVIINDEGVAKPVTGDSNETGILAETSAFYGNNPYLLVGEGAYSRKSGVIGKLKAGMTLNYNNGSFEATIIVKDNENNTVTQNKMRIIPLGVAQ